MIETTDTDGIRVLRLGAERCRGQTLNKIGILFQPLQQRIIVDIQSFEPVQGLPGNL